MNTILEQVGEMLGKMTRGEKARVLQWVAADIGNAFPGIDTRADVCGGEPCVVRTRIPVWTLVQARRLGLSDADILKAYPALNVEDIAEAWSYFRAHRSEIEHQIKSNEKS